MNGFGFGILMPTSHSAINHLVHSSERGAANSTYMISYDLGMGSAPFSSVFYPIKVTLGEIYAYTLLLLILSGGIFVLKAIPHYHRSKVKDDTTGR